MTTDLTDLLTKHGPAPYPLTESTPQLYGLLFYLTHPDMIEGWDPNEVEGESRVSEETDERNSRPFPY